MEVLIVGILTAFNLIVIRWKFNHDHKLDALLDLFMITILNILFGGTKTGMSIAMVASFTISYYLYLYPPDLSPISTWFKEQL